MRLILAEKPNVGADIARVLGAREKGTGCIRGDGVTISWCIGHLLAQMDPDHYNPEVKYWKLNQLPVIPEKWEMEVIERTKSQFNIVSSLIKKASEIVIATDADREGEVIAREVLDLVGTKAKLSRLWLSATDSKSIKTAFANLRPATAYLSWYHSGLGRMHSDWLAGMNLTMAYTTAFGGRGKENTLHIGRVITPVLGLVVRRERAIQQFVPKSFSVITTLWKTKNTQFSMKWMPARALLDQHGHIIDHAAVARIAAKVGGKVGQVDSIKTESGEEAAPLPYYLGALQKEANARFGLKAQTVLDAAQALYERYKATTYPRTDCEYLPSSMFTDAQERITAIASINPEYKDLASKASTESLPRCYNDKKILSHHAIIPTGHRTVDIASMSKTEKIVYDLICRRFLAQFLGAHCYDQTNLTVICEGETFTATGKVSKRLGWRESNQAEPVEQKKKKGSDDEDNSDEVTLPHLVKGDAVQNLTAAAEQRKTKPPRRYTEGTLISAMESIDKEIDDPRLAKIMRTKEKAGIGTDATRGAAIEKLFDGGYFTTVKKQIAPTEKGLGLIDLVEKHTPEIADPVLTAIWEDKLEQMKEGTYDLAQFESEISTWLKLQIEQIKKAATETTGKATFLPKPVPSTNYPCPECTKPMRPLDGKNGPFWGCTAYAEGCRATLPDDNGKPGTRAEAVKVPGTTPEKNPPGVAASTHSCPVCSKPMRQRHGTNGLFWGCSGYPACKTTAPDKDGKPLISHPDIAKSESGTTIPSVGEICPTCNQGSLQQRVSKGKPFIGCTRFPDCRHFKWT